MAIIKEYREFFLRHTPVTTGTKADQEVGYATQYYIGTTLVYNRFLKSDYPSSGVFKKLFESLTFKLNKEDTAKLTEQGLSKIASDSQAIARTSNADTDFTATVVPHQLPEVITTFVVGQDSETSQSVNSGIKVTEFTRTIGGKSRRIYRVGVELINSLEFDGDGKLQLANDVDAPGNYFAYATDAAGNKGWINLAGLISSMAQDEIEASELRVKKFVKEFVTTDIEANLVIPYTELIAAIGSLVPFNAGYMSTENDTTGTTQSTPTIPNYLTDINITIWYRATTLADWERVDLTNPISSGSSYTKIDKTSGDITIVTGGTQGIFRVVIIG